MAPRILSTGFHGDMKLEIADTRIILANNDLPGTSPAVRLIAAEYLKVCCPRPHECACLQSPWVLEENADSNTRLVLIRD